MIEISIYLVVDPRMGYRKGYVGKTIYPIEDRLQEHLDEAKNKLFIDHKNNWLKKLLSLGLRPTIHLLETVDETNWAEKENYWIEYCRDVLGWELTNTYPGGYSITQHPPVTREIISRLTSIAMQDPEIKKKCGASGLGRAYWKDKERPAITRKRIGDSCRIALSDPSVKQKMKDSHLNHVHSQDHKNKIRERVLIIFSNPDIRVKCGSAKGTPKPAGFGEKVRKAQINKKHSPERCKSNSDAQKRVWAQRKQSKGI